MLGKDFNQKVLAATLILQTGSLEDWTELRFKNIPANQVQISGKSFLIKVSSSASPLVYRLPQTENVTGFSWKLNLQGDLKTSGKGFEEDSYFRLGLVAAGERTLGRLQRLVAADWVQKLFSLAPKGVGLDQIYFFNLGREAQQLKQSRQHPKSELIHETIIAIRTGANSEVQYQLDKKLPVVAVWLSIDGDDSKSSYQVQVQELKLLVEEASP